jgi:hypothetical protein
LAVGFAASILLAATPAIAAAPSISISSVETKLSQAECLQKGDQAMRAIGFTQNKETVGASVFGEQGNYLGTVRCMTANGVVIFVVAGPDVDRCKSSGNVLRQRFGN